MYLIVQDSTITSQAREAVLTVLMFPVMALGLVLAVLAVVYAWKLATR